MAKRKVNIGPNSANLDIGRDQRSTTSNGSPHGLPKLRMDHGTTMFHITICPNDGGFSITHWRVC